MCMQKRRCGLTMIEVLILLGILGCVVVMLLPAVQSSREAARRATCVNHLKQLGLAFQNYASVHRTFPASSGVTWSAVGKITAVDGWSWQAELLHGGGAGGG
jgi:type II secretory pathway pseudopilin PulG